ncbi:biotin-dependent carboxyltransferase family protein [Pectobacterium cacticida]|uniref:Biotin-dependent carboxyltransferase family protein n=1 Tax=Pectobacterium cacticida TaxID=69221 RepID=A0ABZ2GCC4_9GAMM|nr:biotin-dependent carboxyltransferase family protein [Pectobacterium cacticida]UYX06733.1 biotin-dependent carboxyltransferase family protein [Pectobacterium cacticida]
MRWLDVISPGLFTTVQDAGRYGYAHLGVPASGPMDMIAFRLANAIVGNGPECAALELTALGGRYRVMGGECILCLGGAVEAQVAGRKLEPWVGHRLAEGSELIIGRIQRGLRAYLALSGGIEAQPVLGSRATLTRASLGGWQGRALRKGDRLPLAEQTDTGRRHCSHALLTSLYRCGPLSVVMGPQQEAFTAASLLTFLHERYRVSVHADRMGYRMAGPALAHTHGADMVSDAVVPGSIQVPGNGQPIIALHDRQTTGGYPKIATLIGADLPRVGQLRPGQSVAFRAVTAQEGVAHWRRLQEGIAACLQHIQSTQASWL